MSINSNVINTSEPAFELKNSTSLENPDFQPFESKSSLKSKNEWTKSAEHLQNFNSSENSEANTVNIIDDKYTNYIGKSASVHFTKSQPILYENIENGLLSTSDTVSNNFNFDAHDKLLDKKTHNISTYQITDSQKNLSIGSHSITKSTNNFSYSVSDGFPNESQSKRTVLENIAEVDENVSEIDETPMYYGWDGYEAKFEEKIQDTDSRMSVPKCIPPWAKSIRTAYGLPSLESINDDVKRQESKRVMQEKLENLMKKHKDLMLLKRVESRKQVIVQPSTKSDELDIVNMRGTNTRYYMTPLTVGESKASVKSSLGEVNEDLQRVSMASANDYGSSSMLKKTSRPQAKREISRVLKSIAKSAPKTQELKEHEYKTKNDQLKCPKITLSKIRDFVSMSPDERNLHEIIKIEKVPSIQDLKQVGTPLSKYTINVPQSKTTDKPTVNIIKIKQKRKLRADSAENIEEHVTELRYNQGRTRGPEKSVRDFIYNKSSNMGTEYHSKKKTKSATETKTFEITTKQTPLLMPLINEKGRKTEKVLLIQYDKKTKLQEHTENEAPVRTTQLLGIKQPCTGVEGEMYLYGSEIYGKETKENVTKIEDMPPTLKDKVHKIFEELKELSFKREPQEDIRFQERTNQRPPHFQVTTDVAMVQAKPEVISAAVQVRQSQILEPEVVDSVMMVVPNPTPTSIYVSEMEGPTTTISSSKLNDKLTDLLPEKTMTMKIQSTDKVDETKVDLQQRDQKTIGIQPTDGARSRVQPTNESRFGIPPTDKPIAGLQPQDKMSFQILTDKTSFGIQPTDKTTSDIQPTAKTHSGIQPTDKTTSERQPIDKTTSEIHPKDKSGSDIQQNEKKKSNLDLLPKQEGSLEQQSYEKERKTESFEVLRDKVDEMKYIPEKKNFPEKLTKIKDGEEETEPDDFRLPYKTTPLQETKETPAENIIPKQREEPREKLVNNKPNTQLKGENQTLPWQPTTTMTKSKSKDLSTFSKEPQSTLILSQPSSERGTNIILPESLEKSPTTREKVLLPNDGIKEVYLKRGLTGHGEDIRSYDIVSEQYKDFEIEEPPATLPPPTLRPLPSVLAKSSHKFLHKKDALRKRMNWTDDTVYLEENTCPTLPRGLAVTAMTHPADPIAFLAHFIIKEYENREIRDYEEVRHEHLVLAKTMADVSGDKQTSTKFNVRKYPISRNLKEISMDVTNINEETNNLETDVLMGETGPQEIAQTV